MTAMRKIAAALLALVLVFAAPALSAEAGGGFSLEGQVQHPAHFAMLDLQALQQTQVSVSYVTGHGEEAGTFSGVLLWTLLTKTVLIEGPGKGALLRHVITVTGRDGYAVVLSAGELAPNFEGKSVILALSKGGQSLKPQDGIRLIVPSDKHGGRAVRDVVKIDVR